MYPIIGLSGKIGYGSVNPDPFEWQDRERICGSGSVSVARKVTGPRIRIRLSGKKGSGAVDVLTSLPGGTVEVALLDPNCGYTTVCTVNQLPLARSCQLSLAQEAT